LDALGLDAWYSYGGGHASITVSDPSSNSGYTQYSYDPTEGGYDDPLATINAPGQMNVFHNVDPGGANSLDLHTTPAQDAALRASGNAVHANPGNYNPATHNCATVARNMLGDAGINTPWSPVETPWGLKDDLTNMLDPANGYWGSRDVSPVGAEYGGYMGP